MLPSLHRNGRLFNPCHGPLFDCFKVFPDCGQYFRRMNTVRQQGVRLLFGIAQHTAKSGIYPDRIQPFGVRDDDAVHDLVVDGLKLVAVLPQGRLGVLAFGDVAEEGGDTLASTENKGVANDIGVQDAAVLPQDGNVYVIPISLTNPRPQPLQQRRSLIGGVNVQHGHRKQLIFRVSQHPAERGVDPDKPLRLEVQDQQPFEHTVVDRPKLVEALPQGLFGGPADIGFTAELPVRCGQVGGALLDPPFQLIVGPLQRLLSLLAFDPVYAEDRHGGNLPLLIEDRVYGVLNIPAGPLIVKTDRLARADDLVEMPHPHGSYFGWQHVVGRVTDNLVIGLAKPAGSCCVGEKDRSLGIHQQDRLRAGVRQRPQHAARYGAVRPIRK